MEGTHETGIAPARRVREQAEPESGQSVEIGLPAQLPLEVNMTDEPGGDPYNHTGQFRRMFR